VNQELKEKRVIPGKEKDRMIGRNVGKKTPCNLHVRPDE